MEAKSESDQIQCWGENPNTQMVRFEKGDGSFQLYPYSWLECVQFSPAENEDKLVVIFGEREIRITGNGLRKLALLLQSMAVDWIKEVPDRFDSFGSDDETIIRAIEIISKAKDGKKPA